MSALADAPRFQPRTREEWRAWLTANHATATGVWLVTWRRRAGVAEPSLDYEAQIEEALCYGWIDGIAGTLDERRSKLYFSPRRAGSGWAATNKARVERLIAEGRMQPAGLAVIERAKADGSWTLLDSVERLEVPGDLAAALAANPAAGANFAAFPPSARKQLLAWVVTAKRPDTRTRRVAEVVEASARNERAR
ncbi:MAG TPA: YdeI/OmpD-associated family protein [Candidatus Limnocylindrales bacterium]|nr:YdeI/OmpD-associated family protein [Candidatus Limnocylindrales bacterium]